MIFALLFSLFKFLSVLIAQGIVAKSREMTAIRNIAS